MNNNITDVKTRRRSISIISTGTSLTNNRQDWKNKLTMNQLQYVYNLQIVELLLLMVLNLIENHIKNKLVLLLYYFYVIFSFIMGMLMIHFLMRDLLMEYLLRNRRELTILLKRGQGMELRVLSMILSNPNTILCRDNH